MKLTRRRLAQSAAGMAFAWKALPQTPPASPGAPDALLASERESRKRNSEALAKIDVPMPTEPAFSFKA